MILGDNREAVIENIKKFAESGEFHNKVELNDPVLTAAQSREITNNFIENRKKWSFKFKSVIARRTAQVATKLLNKNTEIIGIEKIPQNIGGILVTSNHFSPIENTVVRHLTNKLGYKNLSIISQTTNFAMPGVIGFLMNYADTIPISTEPRYLARNFLSVLKEKLVEKKGAVLLYPEQEMWFNYKKPRPPKGGAYFYSAKLNIPIVSCFVEMTELDEDENTNKDFKQVKYTLHVLSVLYPDPSKTTKENTELMAETDYNLKKECYEKVYGKKLDYTFQNSDIAGWKKGL
ncbi:MAG: 1-acyl-sn-glycerol-3-phosphate acyltransferase [Clostridia bacterium]|nr:1-acyl-sn-glycerol-3-phosphate acyltransferase [Clostridia bacterium]